MSATCKGCGAKIEWIRTPGGKNMPVDREAVLYWENPKGKGKIVTRNGEVISCDLEGDVDNATGIGFIPHWSTCPDASKFHKGGK